MNVAATQTEPIEPVAGSSLFSRIFRASLLVGLIGLLGVALLLALNWRQGRVTLAMTNEQAPIALAASELMLGLSLAQFNLNAWFILGEPRYREAWQDNWHQQIMPAISTLQMYSARSEMKTRVEPLHDQLMALEEVQWWVQEYAASDGNDRGRALLQLEMLPVLDSANRHLEGLARAEELAASNSSYAELVEIARLRSELRLFESLLHALSSQREAFRAERIRRLSTQIDEQFEKLQVVSDTAEAGALYTGALRDWQAISALTDRFLQQMEQPDSNAARMVMRSRATPLAEDITRQAGELVGLVRQRLANESARLSQNARNATLGAMAILLMLAAATAGVSWWFSRRLSRPVRRLSAATRAFSLGEQVDNLPVPDTREFAELTSRFNEMRQNISGLLTDLNNTNKELEQFAYTVSHDLRAPLRAIDGFSQALVEDYGDQLQGEAREYLELLSQGARDMGRLIDDILWLSRSTRGDMNLERADLSELAEEIIASLRRAEPDRKVECLIQPNMIVKGDQRLLKNMLDNLLGNAWKFTAQSMPARIRMTAKDEGRALRIVVEDNGAGFDMAYADKLFKPFHRLHSQSEFAGTGIGLSSALRIINRHRGQIEAWGEPGKGARFTIELEKWKATDS